MNWRKMNEERLYMSNDVYEAEINENRKIVHAYGVYKSWMKKDCTCQW
jgi:hypothetical protein